MFEKAFEALENLVEAVVVVCGFEGMVILLVIGGILGVAVSKKIYDALVTSPAEI